MKIPEVEGEPRWGKLPMRIGWVFKKNYRSANPLAVARAFWHVVIRKYVYEICANCGRPVSDAIHTYWLAADKLWEHVNGQMGGTLCPRCFAQQAEEMGISVAWVGMRTEDVDDYHRNITRLERIFDAANGAEPWHAFELLNLIHDMEIETVREKLTQS